MSILDVLVKQGVIEAKDFSSIKQKTESSGESLEESLISIGISEEDILRAKSEYYVMPVKKIDISAAFFFKFLQRKGPVRPTNPDFGSAAG